jgi:hypothetical protein
VYPWATPETAVSSAAPRHARRSVPGLNPASEPTVDSGHDAGSDDEWTLMDKYRV